MFFPHLTPLLSFHLFLAPLALEVGLFPSQLKDRLGAVKKWG